jgi:hypothetical protein
MPSAYTTLWTQDRCRELRRRDRVGQRPPAAFSGIHSSLPSWRGTEIGDDMYAMHVRNGMVYVVCRMRIVDKERRGCCGAQPANYREPAFPGHGDWEMLGAQGCSATAVHVDATPVRFDRLLPGSLLPELSWRNQRGQTRGLRFVEDGRLIRHLSLDGVYRLTPESADMLRPFAD